MGSIVRLQRQGINLALNTDKLRAIGIRHGHVPPRLVLHAHPTHIDLLPRAVLISRVPLFLFPPMIILVKWPPRQFNSILLFFILVEVITDEGKK